MQSKSINRIGASLLFSIGLAIPAAANGLLVNAGASTANFNFLDPAYCNNSTGDINSATGPMLSASQACSSANVGTTGPYLGTGVDSMTANAAAFASFGIIGASIDSTEAGIVTVAPLPFGAGAALGSVAQADAEFVDSAFLNIAGLAADAPVTLTLGFTLSGLSTSSFSPDFSGNNTPTIDYNLNLFLGQAANIGLGADTSVSAFNGNPLLPGLYTVTTTVLNDEDIYFYAALDLQANFPMVPLGTGIFSASADADFINTAQLTSIGISDGTNSYTNYSLIGSSNNTNYQQVLTEGDSAAAPEPGSMALTALGAGIVAWLASKRAART